jgi:uncharacterized protein
MTVMLRKLAFAAVISAATVACTGAFGQEPASAAKSGPAKKHFIIMLKPGRPGFVDAPTAAEQKTMGEHFAYLKKQLADGKVLLGGPSINGEKTFGIVVVQAASEAEARAIMEGDPSIRSGVMKGEVLPFTLALMRGQ